MTAKAKRRLFTFQITVPSIGLKKNFMPPQSTHRFTRSHPMAVRHHEESELATAKVKTSPPPLYKVLLLNDDYTPMDFVIQVLQRFFQMGLEQATVVMLKVHNEGSGLAGIYTRDVAETKVNQVTDHAREHHHPLQCVMEENQ
jgi:ATP-dependent Clp protease adaptor protein ClpS